MLDELLPRIVHCCWQDTWAARLGGAAGVRLLTFKLPASYLRYVSPQLVRALLTVSRFLPGEGPLGCAANVVPCGVWGMLWCAEGSPAMQRCCGCHPAYVF